jgi:hypothetical protein
MKLDKKYSLKRILKNTIPTKKNKKYLKKGGTPFGPASFDSNFGGSIYPVNNYVDQLFPVPTTHSGGGKKTHKTHKKRCKLLRKTINRIKHI